MNNFSTFINTQLSVINNLFIVSNGLLIHLLIICELLLMFLIFYNLFIVNKKFIDCCINNLWITFNTVNQLSIH